MYVTHEKNTSRHSEVIRYQKTLTQKFMWNFFISDDKNRAGTIRNFKPISKHMANVKRIHLVRVKL